MAKFVAPNGLGLGLSRRLRTAIMIVNGIALVLDQRHGMQRKEADDAQRNCVAPRPMPTINLALPSMCC